MLNEVIWSFQENIPHLPSKLLSFLYHFLPGSTSSSLCDHWVNRLPGSRPASLASGASSRRTSLASLAESVEFPGERSEDDGEIISSPLTNLKLLSIIDRGLQKDVCALNTKHSENSCQCKNKILNFRVILRHYFYTLKVFVQFLNVG